MRTIALLCLFFPLASFAHCPVPLQSSSFDLPLGVYSERLRQYFACSFDDPLSSRSPCNVFVIRALSDIYGVPDFKTQKGDFLSANEIVRLLESGHNEWAEIGSVSDSSSGLCAQVLANRGFPVVAAMRSKDHGHVALVLPGMPALSTSWKTYAPNSASFFLDRPEKGYFDRPLSKAFSLKNAMSTKYFFHRPSPFA